jgi:hypothetical protein
VVLPLLAVLLPALLSIGHATTHAWFWTPKMATPSALIIYDVFLESVPFMIAAGIVGLASPAAGALLALVYAVGNLAVTYWSDELIPVAGATFGRLVTYLVLWLLVVESPLMARGVYEWWSSRDDAIRKKRVVAIVAATLSATALTWIWVLGAPLMVVTVFFLTSSWAQPPYPPFGVMEYYGWMVVAGLGLAALPLLAVRYLGVSARVGRDADEPGPLSRRGAVGGYLGTLAVTLMTLASVIHKPVDALILLAGVLAARPIARVVLRATGLAPLLAAIARPIRLIAGFGVTLGFAWVFLAIVGASPISPFFHAVIAIAAGFIIIEVFLAADDVVVAAPAEGGRLGKALTMGAFLYLALPSVAHADNMADEEDVKLMAAAAAASVAGAKAWDTAKKKKFPPKVPGASDGGSAPDGGTPSESPPPPWYTPDGFKSSVNKSMGN